MSARADRTMNDDRRRRRALRRAASPTMRLNMTPMIDVVFLLLIYFVLVADFARPSSIADLDVVQRSDAVADPFALPEVPTVLNVTSTGDARTEYAIDTEQPLFMGATLGEAGARALGSLGPEHPVIVRVSPTARWEHAVVVYRALREIGFRRVDLRAEDG